MAGWKEIRKIGFICDMNSRSGILSTMVREELEKRGIRDVQVWAAGMMNAGLEGKKLGSKYIDAATSLGYKTAGEYTRGHIESEENVQNAKESDLILTMDWGQKEHLLSDLRPAIPGIHKKVSTLKGKLSASKAFFSRFQRYKTLTSVPDPYWEERLHNQDVHEAVVKQLHVMAVQIAEKIRKARRL